MDALGKILQRLKHEVSPQTITVYTRHTRDHCKIESSMWKRCNCPKWLYVFQDGKDYRFSAQTKAWVKAEHLKRAIEESLDPVQRKMRELTQHQEAKRVTIEHAVEQYLLDAKVRNLADQTLRQLKGIFKTSLLTWADIRTLAFLDQLTTAQLTQWRSTWILEPITKRNRQERLRNFFRFCIGQGWMNSNPALQLTRIKVATIPTDYFTREEFSKLVKATSLFANGSRNPNAADCAARLRTLLLLMRFSGLRLGDAVTLERSRLIGNSVLLYQAKTGTSVYVPIPATVAELLRNVPPGMKPNPRYFFWSGNGKKESSVGAWDRAFRKLFKIADLRNSDGTRKKCHSHMLRDTFAVEHLLAGMPIEQVSMLLGHKSIKMTEKHYALT